MHPYGFRTLISTLAITALVTTNNLAGAVANAPLTAEELQAFVDAAQSSVRTGQGTISENYWRIKSNGGKLELNRIYKVAYDGPRFKAVRDTDYLKNENGNADLSYHPEEAVSFDGEKVVVFEVNLRTATTGDLTSGTAGRVCKTVRPFAHAQGCAASSAVLAASKVGVTRRDGPSIVGSEDVDGNETLVREWSDVHMVGNTEKALIIREWMVPTKGFSVARKRVWTAGEGGENKTVLATIDYSLAQIDGVWIAARATQKNYTNGVETSGSIVSTDSDFKFNAPISAAQLAVVIPSGTTVYDELLDAEYITP